MGRNLEGKESELDGGPWLLLLGSREAICRAAVIAGAQGLAAGRKGGTVAGRQRE